MTKTSDSNIRGFANQGRPHVVMMVANDVRVDTRVRKTAESLAATGLEVTVIGLNHRGSGFEEMVGHARLVVLEVGRQFRRERSRLAGRRFNPYKMRSQIEYRREAFQARQREAAARISWIREEGRTGRGVVSERAVARKEGTLAFYRTRRAQLKSASRGRRRPMRIVIANIRGLIDGVYTSVRAVQKVRTAVDLRRAIMKPRIREWRVRRRLSIDKHWQDLVIRRLKRQLVREQGPNERRKGNRRGSANWRNELPALDDYESVLGRYLDKLRADVFHTHDFHLLGVAARAAARARYRGTDTRVVYDAHEYVAGVASRSPRLVEAYVSLEKEYINRADRVITVSEPLADLLVADHKLARRPDVVLNIPVIAAAGSQVPSLYEAAAVPRNAKTLVYSGGMSAGRGVGTIVEALPLLPDVVHLVLVSKSTTNYVLSLFDLAEELGVGHRVHLAPYVAPNDVVEYLSEATVGVHPMISSIMNHQIALPNKLFEYLHAGLPICVSDNKAMVDFVTETGIGEWFIAEDSQSLAAAVSKVLEDRDRYVQARFVDPDLLKRFSWDRQEERLVEVYRELLDLPALTVGRLPAAPSDANDAGRAPALVTGPHNFGGHATAWADALVRYIPRTQGSVIMVVRPENRGSRATDQIELSQWWDTAWQKEHRERILQEFTHVLFESGSPILGGRREAHFDADLEVLAEAGLAVGLILHGPDIRDPAIHRQLVAASPFRRSEGSNQQMDDSTSVISRLVKAFDGPVFVATKDLIDYVPDAVWLPQIVDMDTWQMPPIRMGTGRPVVVFVHANDGLQGAEYVEAVCEELQRSNLIEYRSFAKSDLKRMPEIMAEADVLVDGIALGLYGMRSVEGMAAGRLVLANVERIIDKPGKVPPIVNVAQSTLEETLLDVINRPGHYQEIADRGPGYASRFHDGRYSASQLAGFLGVEMPTLGPAITDGTEAVALRDWT